MFLLSVWGQFAHAALNTNREYTPVVIEARQLAQWSGVQDLRQIGLFRFDGASSSFVAIPFQIDKRRLVKLIKNIDNPNTTGGSVNVCEYGYFRELGVAAGSSDDNFASNVLQPTDEIVFMAFDTSVDNTNVGVWLSDPNVDGHRYRVSIKDPVTGEARYVYAFLWNSGTPVKSSATYVSWAADSSPGSNCPTQEGAQSYCAGFATGVRGAGFPSALNTVKAHFKKNWVTDELHVDQGSGYQSDMITQMEYQEAGEDQDGWSSAPDARFLGAFDTSGGAKPVRVVRGVQGAESGADTTKYEFIYPTAFVSRVNLRVHPIPGLDAQIPQEDTVLLANPLSRIWTATRFDVQAPAQPAPLDTIDLQGPAMAPSDQATAFLDWTEIANKDRGSYDHVYLDLRPPPAASRVYTYKDALDMGTKRTGMFGREWKSIGVTQDGKFNDDYLPCPGCTINDGGCTSDPESLALNFARLEQWVFPQMARSVPSDPGVVQGDSFAQDLLDPLTLAAIYETQGLVPVPTPTCNPTLSSVGSTNGVANLTISNTGCSPSISGFRLYRALGSGSFHLLKDLRTNLTFTDIAVATGTTYRYAVTSYNEVNAESTLSTAAQLTVTDTTPPAVPTGTVATTAADSVTVTWSGGLDRDLAGYQVWMADGSGGTYVLQNSTPLPASGNARWIQGNLANGHTYCFKVAAVDFQGNASAQSSEVCAVPGP